MRRALTNTVRVTLLATACVLALAAPAIAANYPPNSPNLGTDKSAVPGGGSLTITSDGWQPSTIVTFTLNSDPVSLGTTTVSSAGTFSYSTTIPCVDPGTHTIVADGTGSNGAARSSSTTITVQACATGGDDSMPVTGSNTTRTLLTIVAVLLLVGSALLIVGLRRRNADEIAA